MTQPTTSPGNETLNLLQKLITENLQAGKTLRGMSRESGVDHSNLSRYHSGKLPDSVNAAKLAAYFVVDFRGLLDSADMGRSLEDQLGVQEWQTLTPDQKLQVVQFMRKLKAEG